MISRKCTLNGQPTGHTVPSVAFPDVSFAGWHPVSITSGFVCGYNCLDFYVTNAHADVNPTGFRAELTKSGNSNSCTFTITVRDTQPPQINCSTNLLANADSGHCSKSNVTYTVSAIDLCAGTNVTIVCSPPSGSTFAVGTNTVTCRATDILGNSNSCSFSVTVKALVDCGPGSCLASYTIRVSGGTNLIANQLDQTNNTLDAVLPSVPNGAALYKFDPTTQSFSEPALFISGFGWLPNLTLEPGEVPI